MEVATLVPDVGSAQELAGVLSSQPRVLRAFEWSELAQVFVDLLEGEKKARLRRAEIIAEIVERAGPKVTDRAKALEEFCRHVEYPVSLARADLRILRYVPPEKAEAHPDLTIGHLRNIAERTAVPGDTVDERQERVDRYLERASDEGWTVAQTRRVIEAELRPEVLPPREEVLRRVSCGLAEDLHRRHPEYGSEFWEEVAGHAAACFARALEGFQVVRP